jgi:molybdopterin converting factor small subunit
MQITIKLFATFRVGRFNSAAREYPAGTTVGEIIRELEIPEKELGMVLVNSRHVELDQQLNEGDSLSIFPLVGGG